MNSLLKQIMANEVYPAVGCTEPIACAYATAVAAENLSEKVLRFELLSDTGTFKNGAAVIVPNSCGQKGNRFSAAMGAVLASSAKKLELLLDVSPDQLKEAEKMCFNPDANKYSCIEDADDFLVDVTVYGENHTARCILSEGHINIERIEKDGEAVFTRDQDPAAEGPSAYRDSLEDMTVSNIIIQALKLDKNDRKTIQAGIDMNLALVEAGRNLKLSAFHLSQMKDKGIFSDDLVYQVKHQVACAVDARMSGIPLPAMTSGGSGNQGVVGILTPYLTGQDRKIDSRRIIEGIAIAHILNAYIKCYVRELSAVCGCGIGAGIAAAAAIVYMVSGNDMPKITAAINNVAADLSGSICDGAKPGCAMKAVTAVDAAIRGAFMAVEGFNMAEEGLVGTSAESTVKNLGRLARDGMHDVDPMVIDILNNRRGMNVQHPTPEVKTPHP